MFDIGFSELLLVGVVALLVFGPERLPELARNGALWLGRLRRAMRDAKQSIKDELGTDEIMQQLHNEEVLRKLGEDVSQRQRADPLQVDRTGDQQRLNADQGFAFEGDVENLVLVADFRERQRDRRAAVADAIFAVDPLRFVQMAQGHIADIGAEEAGGQGFGIADDQAALGVFADRAARHMGMADGDQGLARLAFGVGGCDQPFMHLADAAQVVIAQVGAGDFGGAQKRQGQAPGGNFALGIGQGDQQAFGIELAVVEPQHPAQGMGAQAAHQGGGQFDPRAGVVVAGNHHDGQFGLLLMGADDKVVEPLLGFDRRVDGVEDITGDQQHIGLVFCQPGQ